MLLCKYLGVGKQFFPFNYMEMYSLIGLLKLFLFCKIAVHIFENSAFRNPFIPATKKTDKTWKN